MSAEVIQFPSHKWASCKSKTCTGCFLCHGGLALCSTCGGMEGALTTHCPGKRMDSMLQDAVYNGLCDFKDGEWHAGPSPHSPAFYKENKGA